MKKRVKPIKKEIFVLGDKSISHRALMISSISEGISKIYNLLLSEDCISTINCLRKLGIKIDVDRNLVRVYGKGLYGFNKSFDILDARNSGTTMRLLSGILSGYKFQSILDGDNSLRKRPMDRIIKPLTFMGANIYSKNTKYAPLYISGGNLKSIYYDMEVKSAQVKSCILFGGLYSQGKTSVCEKVKTRDHTERMLKAFGGNLTVDGDIVSIESSILKSIDINVPGDISSASFFMVLGSIINGSEVTIKDICINETRSGIIEVLLRMGVSVNILNVREDGFEKVADILIYGCEKLKPIHIKGDIVPSLIDEIPIIAAICVFAEGESIIEDIGELRLKESDRIISIVSEFKKIGVDVEELQNGIKINGGKDIYSSKVFSYNDHRIAMSLSIIEAASNIKLDIVGKECVDISFPGFYRKLYEVLN